ncbi:hypothetical protein BDR03DRAFT_969245 [Suillus americanus]|nr:hypothetical protein BDR03DRAFT_969245 [Suillus americanus]
MWAECIGACKMEVYTQGPPCTPTWHATLYINDIKYSHGTTHTKDRAHEMAAIQAAGYFHGDSRQHAGRTAQMERMDVSQTR